LYRITERSNRDNVYETEIYAKKQREQGKQKNKSKDVYKIESGIRAESLGTFRKEIH
jgi:hypothetical protein